MKPIASLSLDLDNKWSYMKTHGDAEWESFPTYLDVIVPRALAFLAERKLDITFFVVGQDAALEKNRDAIASIASAGHEIGNHSFNHEPWLHLYSKMELSEEFERTENAIFDVTGKRTVGFRGPGYSLSPTVLEVMAERGYEYDCSTLPTYIAPLARAYYFFKSPEMSDEEREKRKKLFGKFSDGFRSLKPYSWQVGSGSMIEIPVTTLPIFKTPIHASYLLYLSTFSKTAARFYWKSALAMCRMTDVQPSILLHPLDFLTGDDVPELKFFPAMGMQIEQKLSLMAEFIDEFAARFSITTMREHAQSLANQPIKALDYGKQPA
ncbi:MAG: polysaccharide deacetylase family protein [Pyrinomonadaceae bacterium]|nr:polysaccharide deacetylase family protein [Acidobacteriota bacterium]MBK7932144.1 polysaccharide deacetylase family protein [Acidobacteriota bacterium]MBP7376851.1 polysaccharide deacetylase family protein [Pyrinomonadaceae bacterium]